MMQESLDYQGSNFSSYDLPDVRDEISYINLNGTKFTEDGPGPYLVLWQRHPFVTSRVFSMNNQLRLSTIKSAFTVANMTKRPKLAFFQGLSGFTGVRSQVVQPIYQEIYPPHDTTSQRKLVGIVWAIIDWVNYFHNLLPESADGIYVVMKSSCGFVSTTYLNGTQAIDLGLEDQHEMEFSDMEIADSFFSFASESGYAYNASDLPEDICVDELTLHLYPSKTFRQSFFSNEPFYYSGIVLAIFLSTSVVFFTFDRSVRVRQNKMMKRVVIQDKIVSNLFPGSFRDRLYGLSKDSSQDGESGDLDSLPEANVSISGNTSIFDPRAFDYLENLDSSKPLADLFLETTVLFADIAGFTAWSSTREPSQVFILLETIYGKTCSFGVKENDWRFLFPCSPIFVVE